MSYQLTILGCGSAIPSVEKNPTAQLLNANEWFFLIDCAEGTQVQLKNINLSIKRLVEYLFLIYMSIIILD